MGSIGRACHSPAPERALSTAAAEELSSYQDDAGLYEDAPRRQRRVVLRREPRWGLVRVGAWSLGLGYALALTGGAITLGLGNSDRHDLGVTCFNGTGMNMIPLLGPLLGAARWPNFNISTSGGLYGGNVGLDCRNYTGLVYGLETALALSQWSGAALLAVGFLFRETVRVPVNLRVLPGAANTTAGLTVVGTF